MIDYEAYSSERCDLAVIMRELIFASQSGRSGPWHYLAAVQTAHEQFRRRWVGTPRLLAVVVASRSSLCASRFQAGTSNRLSFKRTEVVDSPPRTLRQRSINVECPLNLPDWNSASFLAARVVSSSVLMLGN